MWVIGCVLNFEDFIVFIGVILFYIMLWFSVVGISLGLFLKWLCVEVIVLFLVFILKVLLININLNGFVLFLNVDVLFLMSYIDMLGISNGVMISWGEVLVYLEINVVIIVIFWYVS